ncbi:hypothetical protein A8L59_07195 [Pseudomonas koreensis]|uniref:Uncharacterized protein n=1 Tax=Pseudomonas koreensis TaxID=198620 RepID=A0AAC9BQX1_9PSED|nr:hypothetical protein A8L59_07195 [Pseudomonas koreensis]
MDFQTLKGEVAFSGRQVDAPFAGIQYRFSTSGNFRTTQGQGGGLSQGLDEHGNDSEATWEGSH